MGKFIEMTGERFGRLTVLSQADNLGRKVAWNCLCECGKTKIVSSTHLRTGHTSSCGCLATETTINNNKKYPRSGHPIHKMSRHPLDGVLKAIKQRCTNPNNKRFPDYGGRGITLCDQWLSDRSSFFQWAVENGYQKGLSIDRIDNDKGYSPDNCRWVNNEIQNNNTRKNVYITIDGRTQTLTMWARERGLRPATAYCRLHVYGWTEKEALGFADPPRLSRETCRSSSC